MPAEKRSRRLRAKQLPLRLLESGSAGGDERPPAPDVRVPEGAAPRTLLRVGRRDAVKVTAQLDGLPPPSALVMSITEQPKTRRLARVAAREQGLPWMVDPLVHRLSLDGYRTAPYLDELDYTPGTSGVPYRATDFADPNFLRTFARLVVGAQIDHDAAAIFGASFGFRAIGDAWWDVARQLWTASVAARDAFGTMPLVLPIVCPLSAILEDSAQIIVARTVAAARPDAALLLLDGLHADTSAERLHRALRLAALIRATGITIGIGRAGVLRRLFDCADLGLREVGLGRLTRFQLDDQKGAGGPGIRPARFEVPSLLAALPCDQADLLMRRELVPERGCSCPACRSGVREALEERLVGHNAHVVLAEPQALHGVTVEERFGQFRADVAQATERWQDIRDQGVEVEVPAYLSRWDVAAQTALDSGLGQRKRLARLVESS